jgi:hypothetical protein
MKVELLLNVILECKVTTHKEGIDQLGIYIYSPLHVISGGESRISWIYAIVFKTFLLQCST